MLRFLTAGESHGQALVGILEGFPKGVRISKDLINKELSRRQAGWGRGGRMNIERDKVEFISGLRRGVTLGSPIGFLIRNKDARLRPFLPDNIRRISVPRPAHADLAGLLKYSEKDINNILERASARETASRVVIGSLCRQLLELFGIKVSSFIREFGPFIFSNSTSSSGRKYYYGIERKSLPKLKQLIKETRNRSDTLGGIIEIRAEGVVAGIGSFMQWDRRLDSRLSFALMSIPAVKGVEIGLGFDYARRSGRDAHDSIYYSKRRGFFHKTNNSGGIEGGISTGEPIILRIAMKPIATLKRGIMSVNVTTKKKAKAPSIRSDVAAVYACSVVAEAMTAFILTDSFLEKFSSDTLTELRASYRQYINSLKKY